MHQVVNHKQQVLYQMQKGAANKKKAVTQEKKDSNSFWSSTEEKGQT